ncbi:hypothetical protein ANOM_007530 [Aspergillus nomiae NRRL 13137]|uniref:Methyltransferase domain-containing protein n=1 Tax=Aspergillus nomiae NRRL (strain ATCC 15546 / NRRL 13137 / CBS 260.88 / M93) TaxID=1509407 RepID=A0A0L1ITQ4_ASPN3|nr:uncharacterized protein ANOM_007530 [Aspergillus nomiae NRRL 13137]KNG82887.1 hypothetical protein ANOM_007530 [Aspergillus nomiae NRRL 13137]
MATNYSSLGQWEAELNIGDVIGPDAKELLEMYSGICPTEVNHQVAKVAKQGCEITNYPCFRLVTFLDLELSQSPAYARIVNRIKQGALFIDLGCRLGQDIRRLAYDGAPPGNLVGLDLRKEVVELGYDLFKDSDTFKARFIVQDFFQDTPVFREMIGNIEIINSGLFMHLWNWAGQVRIGRGMVELLTHQGGLITGVHFGGQDSGINKTEDWIERFVHTEMSFRQMWIEIERLTGARCNLALRAQEDNRYTISDQSSLRLQWVVEVQK